MDTKIWKNIQYQTNDMGEATPFFFRGKEYHLRNKAKSFCHDEPNPTSHSLIVSNITGDTISRVMDDHYFTSAYVYNDRCYLFGSSVATGHGGTANVINCSWSDDLVHWSEPKAIFTYPQGKIYNTAVTFDGTRHVLLFETDDVRYPIFTFRFLETTDLETWRLLDQAIYGDKKYVGGPALYYLPKDGYFYVTYVNEFINEETREPNYDTCIARSRDLVSWEEGDRPILFPDYSHRPRPEEHPEVFEINTSDAEFLQKDGKVLVMYNGGNQQGVADNATAEFEGTLAELFQKFFVGVVPKTAQYFMDIALAKIAKSEQQK